MLIIVNLKKWICFYLLANSYIKYFFIINTSFSSLKNMLTENKKVGKPNAV